MAKGDAVADDETLVRALYWPHYDPNHNKVNSSAYMDVENSVSRPAILSMSEIAEIFRADLKEFTGLVCTIGAGVVRQVVSTSESVQLEVEIVEDQIKDEPPASDNPAHALIKPYDKPIVKDGTELKPRAPRKFSKGISKDLLRKSKSWNCSSGEPVACDVNGIEG